MSGGGGSVEVTAAWPDSLPDPSLPIKETLTMEVVRSETEMGVVKTRPKWTEKAVYLKVSYPVLTQAERTAIIDFFDEIGWGGTIFEFTHPETEEVLDVRLTGKLEFNYIGAGKSAMKMTLEKANT